MSNGFTPTQEKTVSREQHAERSGWVESTVGSRRLRHVSTCPQCFRSVEELRVIVLRERFQEGLLLIWKEVGQVIMAFPCEHLLGYGLHFVEVEPESDV